MYRYLQKCLYRGLCPKLSTNIPILQMHFFVLMITHVLWHKVAPHANNMEFPTYLLHFMIAVVACSLYAKAINKYFPWMLRWNYKK